MTVNVVSERLRRDRELFRHSGEPSERAVAASDMLDRLRPVFPKLGITRLARLTGLDQIGVPVWAAVRPNAANLSVSQGKGVDDAAAAVSAVMESAELAMAERRHPKAVTASRSALKSRGEVPLEPLRYLRLDRSLPDDEEELRWVAGYDLIAGRAVMVPEEIVGLVDAPRLTFWQASDGLGAGSCLLEAAVQGMCELIERDALGLWSFKSAEETLAREVDPMSLASDFIATTCERIGAAGLHLRLFDITSDLQIPAFLAVIAPPAAAGRPPLYLQVASGTGAHPSAAKAARRAVLEAAQTRLTTISGARDDIGPEDYQRVLPDDLWLYTGAAGAGSAGTAINIQFAGKPDAPSLFDWLLDRLRRGSIGSAVLVPLETESFGFSVARMVAPDLEQDPGTKNRRLGRRAIATMLGRI